MKVSEYVSDILKLVTGTSISQAIPILISPILTRLFSPEAFGLSALFGSIGSIITIFMTGQYSKAIILPKEENRALSIFILTLIISGVLFLFTQFFIFFFGEWIVDFFENPELIYWIYLVPISALITGLTQSYQNYSNREKAFGDIARANVYRSGSKAGLSLLGANFSTSGGILILASIVSQAVFAIYLAIKNIKKIDFGIIKSQFDRDLIVDVAKTYKNFPQIIVPHTFFNIFSSNIVVYLLALYFSSAVLGFYSLANRIVMLPAGIISNAIGQPFYKKLADLKNRDLDQAAKFVIKTINYMLLAAIIPFALLFFLSPFMFELVFGNEWRVAGEYCQYLVPFFFIRFVGSVVSYVILVYEEQKKALGLEILQTILRGVALLIGGLKQDVLLALLLFSIASVLISGYKLIWYRSIVVKTAENSIKL